MGVAVEKVVMKGDNEKSIQQEMLNQKKKASAGKDDELGDMDTTISQDTMNMALEKPKLFLNR